MHLENPLGPHLHQKGSEREKLWVRVYSSGFYIPLNIVLSVDAFFCALHFIGVKKVLRHCSFNCYFDSFVALLYPGQGIFSLDWKPNIGALNIKVFLVNFAQMVHPIIH